MKRSLLAAGAVAVVIGLVGGGLVGRGLQDDEAAGPAATDPAANDPAANDPAADDPATAGAEPPVAAPVTTAAGDEPRTEPAPAYDVPAAVYPGAEGGAAITSLTPSGVPTIGAGDLVANPGGGPDLAPDPEAGIGGTPPSVEGAPEDPDRADAESLEAVTTMIAEAATAAGGAEPAPAPPYAPVPAFADPCVADPAADGCGGGIEATVLGIRRRPAPVAVWSGQVHASSSYAPECARQHPDLDWRRDSVWAIVLTVPMPAATMHVQFFQAEQGGGSTPRPGTRVQDRGVRASDDLERAWDAAWERGATTPLVPLCLRMDYQRDVEPNRAGCVAWPGLFGTPPCLSKVEMAVGGTGADGFRWGAGLYTSYFTFAPDAGLEPGEADALRRAVQIVPLDPFVFEVKVPFTATVGTNVDAIGAVTRTAQLVTAVGYPGGVDCRDVDPAAGVQLSPLPATRQIGRTRYWAPDDSRRQDREAVITLAVPSRLAQGEAIALCVSWYTFDGPSWAPPTVVNIEQHVVVPPSRAATEIRFAGAGRGGGLFSLPHAQPRGSIDADRLIVSFLGAPRLNQACGFGGTAPAPVLRPLGDEGFLCRVDWATFADPPADVLTYVELPRPAGAATSGTVDARGQRPVLIDNRGCPNTGCGPARIERFDLRDGSWVDLSYTKVPLATEPLLPGGRIVGGRHDGWTTNPGGHRTISPRLRTQELPPNPQLDTISTRLVRNDADPQTALDLVWRADRPVRVRAAVRPRYTPSSTCGEVRAEGAGPAERGRITFARLCPGTTYVVSIELVEDAGAGELRTSTFSWNTGPGLSLIGTTERGRVDPGFDYDFGLTIDAIRGRTSTDRGALSSAMILLGPAVLSGTPPSARDCRPLTGGSLPIAAGSRGADAIIGGETRLQLDLSLALWNPEGADVACPPPGTIWAGRPLRIQVERYLRWDGLTRQSFELATADGTRLTLTLSPATD